MGDTQQKKSIHTDKTIAEEKKKNEACSCPKHACEPCDCDEIKQQLEEYKIKYLRALADYQNYEKRIQNQREDLIASANKDFVERLIPFLDDLDRAELFINDKNLIHVKNTFLKLLEREGLKEMNIINKEYDPYTAEVIDMVPGEKEGIVIEVLRKGYSFNDKIIRVAQVKVTKKI